MQLYGLIGYPLGHSFSKKYFTEKFENEKIVNCAFENFPLQNIKEFPQLLKDHQSLKGLAITIPYKKEILKFATRLSDEVKSIGSANNIKITGDSLVAYNTDVLGFEKSFKRHLKPNYTKALVLGTGGSSLAVQYILKKNKIDFLIVSRNSILDNGIINYEMITDKIINDYPVIINCTPAGMWPNGDTCPNIPYHLLTPHHYLFDLVYKPEKTLYLQKGEQQGAIIQNGYEMLITQAEESWKIWTND